jgi:thiosulfate/3-mercaptopyruvate sulfurtransferase
MPDTTRGYFALQVALVKGRGGIGTAVAQYDRMFRDMGIPTAIVYEGPAVDAFAGRDEVMIRPPALLASPIAPAFAFLLQAFRAEVMRRAGTWNYWILDVRNDLEWAGHDNTPCCARRGHVPHAKHIEWTHFQENGRFKSPEAINALLAQQGINVRHDIAIYCHRGARSANAVYALRYAGIHSARNFIGSWHEWSSRADLPIEV